MKRAACMLVALALSFGSQAAVKSEVRGNNRQSANVNGSITNKASGNGVARINIGSVVGSKVGGNNQSVNVSGSIVNEANGGGKAEVNIGSIVEGEK